MNRGAWLALFFALGCNGPFGPFPGGRLPGDVVEAPRDEWPSTTDWTLALETDFGAPHSVNLHFVTEGSRLWTATVLGRASPWARRALADGRVRVRVADNLYERQAVHVTDRGEIEHVAALYREKYAITPDVSAEGALVFRLDPR